MEMYNDELNAFDQYNYLMDTYIDTIIKLIDTSYSMKILPFKIMFSSNYIKKYIYTNRLEVLQNGLDYLLTNKDTVINFNASNLDELDEDFDDNVSVKSCISNIKQHTNDKNNFLSSSDDMLNLMIEIKNNAKKLCSDDIDIIKKYFELLIIILENIQKVFVK